MRHGSGGRRRGKCNLESYVGLSIGLGGSLGGRSDGRLGVCVRRRGRSSLASWYYTVTKIEEEESNLGWISEGNRVSGRRRFR